MERGRGNGRLPGQRRQFLCHRVDRPRGRRHPRLSGRKTRARRKAGAGAGGPAAAPARRSGTPASRRRRSLPVNLAILAGLVVFAIAGLVAAAYISGNRTVDTPGVRASDFAGTTPADGDSASGGQGQAVDGLPCEAGERLTYHVHAHLFILRDGVAQTVPQYVGIPGAPIASKCIYWLHTHDRTGVIHIEAPAQRSFTLGQFFDIWGQPLSAERVALHAVPAGGPRVFVDGKLFSGDPRTIELGAHTQVVIEIGREVSPPSFSFPAGD